MLKVVGVDPSTKTGICFLGLEGSEDKEVLNLEYETELITSTFDSKTANDHMARIEDIADKVISFVKRYDPNLVVVEGYAYSNKFTSFTAVEINTIIRWKLYEVRKPYILVPPTSLKKFITGKGIAKKQNMILEVYKRWGVEAKTDDEIDAFSLAMFGAAYLGYVTDMPAVNMAVFDNMELCIIDKLKKVRKIR